LLPAERTSKRVLSLSNSPTLPSYLSLSSSLFLPPPPAPFARSSPALVLRPRAGSSCRLRSLSLFAPSRRPPPPTTGPGDNTNAKAFTPLWLPKWNKFFNSRIYRRAKRIARAVAEIIFGGRRRAFLALRTCIRDVFLFEDLAIRS